MGTQTTVPHTPVKNNLFYLLSQGNREPYIFGHVHLPDGKNSQDLDAIQVKSGPSMLVSSWKWRTIRYYHEVRDCPAYSPLPWQRVTNR